MSLYGSRLISPAITTRQLEGPTMKMGALCIRIKLQYDYVVDGWVIPGKTL